MQDRPAGGDLSPLVPLAYLVCPAGAFLVAAPGIARLAPELAGHYYHPRVLALTHDVTLGWITVAIMGASYQLIPIVLGRRTWSERLARWQLVILVCAVICMVTHFLQRHLARASNRRRSTRHRHRAAQSAWRDRGAPRLMKAGVQGGVNVNCAVIVTRTSPPSISTRPGLSWPARHTPAPTSER